jgi:hypothetical protein
MLSKEPALTVGAVLAAVQAGISLLIAFNVSITDEQRDAIILFTSSMVPLILFASFVIRQLVYSKRTVEKIQAKAEQAGAVGVPTQVIQ